MKKEFNYVDVAFVIDTTGSMGPFIAQAKQHLTKTLDELSKKNDINLQVALVEYKDHPPQDSTYVTYHVDFTSDFKMMAKQIDKMQESGGGDGPEAVYQGLFDASEKLTWRPNSSRYILLVGDAPPHAFSAWQRKMFPKKNVAAGNRNGDAWPQACPSGLDVSAVTAVAEKRGITIHSICLGMDGIARDAFEALSMGTGGRFDKESAISEVIATIMRMLTAEFQQVTFDQEVFEVIEKTKVFDCQQLSEEVGSTRQKVAFAVARLGRRGFLASV